MLVAVGGAICPTLRGIVERSAGAYTSRWTMSASTVLCCTGESKNLSQGARGQRGIVQILPFARAYHTPWSTCSASRCADISHRSRFANRRKPLFLGDGDRYQPTNAVRELISTHGHGPCGQRNHESCIATGSEFSSGRAASQSLWFYRRHSSREAVPAIPLNVQHRSASRNQSRVAQLGLITRRCGCVLYERRNPQPLDLDNVMPRATSTATAVRLETWLQPIAFRPTLVAGRKRSSDSAAVLAAKNATVRRDASSITAARCAEVVQRHFRRWTSSSRPRVR